MGSVRILAIVDEEDFLILNNFNSNIRNNKYDFIFFDSTKDNLKEKLNDKLDIILINNDILTLAKLNIFSEIEKTPTIAVIVMFDYGDIDNIRRIMNKGAFDFIVKPIDCKDLDITINRSLGYVKQLRKLDITKKDNDRLKKEIDKYKIKEIYLKNKKDLSIFLKTAFESIIIYEDNKIIDVNNRFIKTFGYNANDLIGTSILDFIDPDYRLIVMNALKSGDSKFDVIAIKQNGEEINVRLFFKTMVYKDKAIKAINLVDITDLKRLDDLRKVNERIVRHELKNQLSGIVGFAQLFLTEDNLKPEHLEWANCILDSSNQLLYILDYSSDILKMEEGIYTLKPKPFDMIKLFNKLNNVIQYTLNHRMGSTSYFINGEPISADDSYYIKGEEKHIEGLFANLIKNVFKYTPKNTKVMVSIEENTDSHRFIIHNNAIIPNRLKSEFNYKEKNSSNKSGLGASSAFIIAKTHGGNVSFRGSDDSLSHLIVEIPKELPSIYY